MAWTEITRPHYQRNGLRYASDTTDEEWAVIEPNLPPPSMCGRKRATRPRDVVNSTSISFSPAASGACYTPVTR